MQPPNLFLCCMWRTFSSTQSNSKCKCIIRCTHRDRWFCHVPVSYYCKWKNWLFIHSDHYSMSGSVRHQDCHLLFFTSFIFFRPGSTSLKEVLWLYLHVGKNHIGRRGESAAVKWTITCRLVTPICVQSWHWNTEIGSSMKY